MIAEVVMTTVELLSSYETLVVFLGVATFLSNVNVIAFWRSNKPFASVGVTHKWLFAVFLVVVLCLNVFPTLSLEWFLLGRLDGLSEKPPSEITAVYDRCFSAFLTMYIGVFYLSFLLSGELRKILKVESIP